MGSRASKAPKRKKQECEPAAKPPADDYTQLPAIIAETRETDEQGSSCVSTSTSQLSPQLQQKQSTSSTKQGLSENGIQSSTTEELSDNGNKSSSKQELSDTGIESSSKQELYDTGIKSSSKQELCNPGIKTSPKQELFVPSNNNSPSQILSSAGIHSSSPKVKTHKGGPAANPSKKESTQLSTTDRENTESTEKGCSCPSHSTSKAPTKLLPTTPKTDLTDPSAQEATKISRKLLERNEIGNLMLVVAQIREMYGPTRYIVCLRSSVSASFRLYNVLVVLVLFSNSLVLL